MSAMLVARFSLDLPVPHVILLHVECCQISLACMRSVVRFMAGRQSKPFTLQWCALYNPAFGACTISNLPTSCAVMQDIVASDDGQRFPLAILPVGKSNDISRVSGWGNVSKHIWNSRVIVPDLLSAVTAAREVRVDFWRTRLASADQGLLKDLPPSFIKLTPQADSCKSEVRVCLGAVMCISAPLQ